MDEYKDLLFKLVEGQGRIEQKVDDTKALAQKNCADIEALKGKPARRWEMVISMIFSAIAGVIAAIFTKKM